jgi:hypothetical protein
MGTKILELSLSPQLPQLQVVNSFLGDWGLGLPFQALEYLLLANGLDLMTSSLFVLLHLSVVSYLRRRFVFNFESF